MATFSYDPDPDLPRQVQACSLALAIMRAAKVRSFADLEGRVPEKVVLLEGQLDLLRSNLGLISYLRHPADGVEGVSVLLCPQCQSWSLIRTKLSAPAKCDLTSDCPGAPIKAVAARRFKETQ